MDFDQLARAVSNPGEFRANFGSQPIAPLEILVTRFFAPKTTDVSGKTNPQKLSWRRLTRLKARPDSRADQNGIAACFLMSNSYVPLTDKTPFAEFGAANQVILVRKQGAKLRHPMYWLLFDTLAHEGKLANFAMTSWDAADPELMANQPLKKYYVPGACMHCHGGWEQSGMLSYLDTDHWLDRTKAGDDFAELGKSRFHPIFDGGKDANSEKFSKSFEVLRHLNEEILQQNISVDPDSFMTRAAAKWIELHKTSHQHVPLLERGILGTDKKTVWNPANETERELLPLLNRYCYRCHSSLAYHVFDKQAVLDLVDDMAYRIEEEDFSLLIPQDRKLDPALKKRLVELLEQLGKENQ